MSQYQWHCEVRDYEIDMQGIVHHAVYINYLEQCRNTYVKKLGIDIFKYHQLGYDLVIAGIDVRYKSSLRPHDTFYVTATMHMQGRFKIIFDQEIRRPNHALVLTAKVICVCVENSTGNPCMPAILEAVMANISTNCAH